MSPLIEEARRRQRRRRIALAGMILAAALAAALVAVLHRGSPRPEGRRATVTIMPLPGGAVIHLWSEHSGNQPVATLVRQVYYRAKK